MKCAFLKHLIGSFAIALVTLLIVAAPRVVADEGGEMCDMVVCDDPDTECDPETGACVSATQCKQKAGSQVFCDCFYDQGKPAIGFFCNPQDKTVPTTGNCNHANCRCWWEGGNENGPTVCTIPTSA